jgi:hypothetical protein
VAFNSSAPGSNTAWFEYRSLPTLRADIQPGDVLASSDDVEERRP